MTIIVGYRAPDGSVWVGADSQVVSGSFIFPEPVKKIVRHGEWRVGVTGFFHGVDLVRRKGRAIAEADNPYDAADLIQNLYREAGYKQCDHSGAPCFEQGHMLAHPRLGVFSLSGSGTVGVPEANFLAIGSGCEIAYGAAYMLARGKNIEPDVFVRAALSAACHYYADCGGELMIEHVDGDA